MYDSYIYKHTITQVGNDVLHQHSRIYQGCQITLNPRHSRNRIKYKTHSTVASVNSFSRFKYCLNCITFSEQFQMSNSIPDIFSKTNTD